MSQKFYTLITTQGAALLANATALGIPLKLTKMAVGDANGSESHPTATQTKLIHEVYRAPINTITTDKDNPNQIIAELVIPETQGGWFINEIGLYDDGDNLIAVGNCPVTYKPKLVEGSGRTQVIRMIIIVDNVDSVQLKIDPAVVLATRKYVDELIATKMADHEKSTNHPDATIKSKGFVQLNSATNSTAENQAATPLAIKTTYDLATGAVKKTGDNMTGDLYINGEPILKKRSYGIGVSRPLGETSIDAEENWYSGFLFSQQKTAGKTPFNFSHVFRSFIGDSIADIAVDILSKRAKFRGVITDRENAEYKGDYSWTEFITSANLNNYLYSYLPVGVPLPWPQATPPAGWFECNGSPFNTSWYPKLTSAYPWGRLPDLRSEFIRGWDNGRGVDSGRGVLSWQNHQVAAHKHVMPWGENGNRFSESQLERTAPFGSSGISGNWLGNTERSDFDNPFFYTNDGTNGEITVQSVTTRWNDLNPVGLVGYENRPRNVAFMYIVKAE